MPTSDQIDHLYAQLQALIADLSRRGFNVGVDSYCAVYALLVSLAGRGVLSDDFGALRRLIAPILCSSPQEQAEFYRLFDERFNAPVLAAKIEQAVQIRQYQEQQRHWLMAAFVSILVLLPALLMGGIFLRPIQNLQPVNQPQVPSETILMTMKKLLEVARSENPVIITISGVTIAPAPPPKPEPLKPVEAPKTPPAQPAFWLMLAFFIATLLWYVVPYLKARRFLTRHQVSEPPELHDFFLKNPVKAFSSVGFARTAQQLHKHRDLDAHLLDVAATVKRTIAAGGQFTPAYQAIKALPEYLVLIDRASYNDQLSAFVQSLLQELQDFGLFIEKYYFDRDPRRCYAEGAPTVPCRLDALQTRYPNHRLIIFSDSRHFVDPIHGKPYAWLEKFHEWQQSFLFTPDAPWDYYKQQLHDAGLVVLATGQQGLATLVNYIASDTAHAQRPDDRADHYPALLHQRPLRFIERHAPDDETIDELRLQLHDYLQQDGFNWLAACAVYPELHWQLTLYLGQARGVESPAVDANSSLFHPVLSALSSLTWERNLLRDWVLRVTHRAINCAPTDLTPTKIASTAGKIDETLLLALARLPWLRHGYMPDWLRLALLQNLDADTEQTIRAQLADLLKTMLQGQAAQAQDLTLAIAQQNPSNLLKHLLPAWWKHSETLSQDFVFQSFMANRLAVSTKNPLPRHPHHVLLGELLVLGAKIRTFLSAETPPLPKPTPRFLFEPEMVAIPAGSFTMGLRGRSDGIGYSDEEPAHTVTLKCFEIGKYPVTQAQWQAVMGDNPSKFIDGGDNCPVENVSWEMAQQFIQKLNALTGKTYRLPSEAEWEYACRGGEDHLYSGSKDIEQVAWYDGNSGEKTHPVGQKQENAWGLHDMSGNVWEWVQDSWHSNYRGAPTDGSAWRRGFDSDKVVRGGSWRYRHGGARCAFRDRWPPNSRNDCTGFRVVLRSSPVSPRRVQSLLRRMSPLAK